MLTPSLLLSLQLIAGPQPADSARLTADTLVVEPLGVRFTIPELWMGRIPAGVSVRSPGRGRYGCQLMVRGPIEERIVVERSHFAGLEQGLFAEKRSYQDALDSIVPLAAMVAHVGGDRFNSNCIAPQIHLYVLDTAGVRASDFGVRTQAAIETAYSSVHRAESDSAGWHTLRLWWTEAKTDFVHGAVLEVWSRTFGGRILIVALMDQAAAMRGDSYEFLASMR